MKKVLFGIISWVCLLREAAKKSFLVARPLREGGGGCKGRATKKKVFLRLPLNPELNKCLAGLSYFMSIKSCPFLNSDSFFKNGQDFLDIQQVFRKYFSLNSEREGFTVIDPWFSYITPMQLLLSMYGPQKCECLVSTRRCRCWGPRCRSRCTGHLSGGKNFSSLARGRDRLCYFWPKTG